MKFSKKIIIAIVISNILFASAILAVFWHTSSEPGVLVGAWFAWTTGECWALANIRKQDTDISLKEMDNVQRVVEDLSWLDTDSLQQTVDLSEQTEQNLEI